MIKKNRPWREMQTYERQAFVIGIFCSVSVVILAFMQIFGIWENAINIIEILLGVLMLSQGTLELRRNKTAAIFSYCVAMFVFTIAFVIYYAR